ncbi:MAG TPA: S41 family peptidase [Chloroflexaceae bacterium]|nr:S41 family peptidase [Chloroflexaceae bacterium]
MVRTARAFTVGAIVALLFSAIAFCAGWVAARAAGTTPIDTFIVSLGTAAARQETPQDLREEFAVFWQVWNLVEGEFYRTEPLDRQELVYGAIRGMLEDLGDEYTTFQEPDLAAQSRESMQGKFEGIGAYLRFVEGEILIDRPFRGSPAERAGLLTGDVVVAVDGQPLAPEIAGLADAEATARAATKIRGPKGSVVTLTLRRPPEPATFEVAITRDEVPLITVHAEMLDGDVAYIQITEFKATTTQLLDEALREIVPQQPASVVLDLRNNPGGYLTTAQEVLGRFYDGVALYERENGGVIKELKTIAGPADARLFDVPMVVLINGGSASAAEIVAGALRDARPNTSLLGERSFGKGSVQNIHQLGDGSSARITIAHWFTPDRAEIHRIGITPEHEVAASVEPQYVVPCVAENRPPEGASDCSDAQLAWGLRLLAGTAPPPAQPSGSAAPLSLRPAAA